MLQQEGERSTVPTGKTQSAAGKTDKRLSSETRVVRGRQKVQDHTMRPWKMGGSMLHEWLCRSTGTLSRRQALLAVMDSAPSTHHSPLHPVGERGWEREKWISFSGVENQFIGGALLYSRRAGGRVFRVRTRRGFGGQLDRYHLDRRRGAIGFIFCGAETMVCDTTHT